VNIRIRHNHISCSYWLLTLQREIRNLHRNEVQSRYCVVVASSSDIPYLSVQQKNFLTNYTAVTTYIGRVKTRVRNLMEMKVLTLPRLNCYLINTTHSGRENFPCSYDAALIYNIFIMETSTAADGSIILTNDIPSFKIFPSLCLLNYQYSIQLVEDNSVHKYKMWGRFRWFVYIYI